MKLNKYPAFDAKASRFHQRWSLALELSKLRVPLAHRLVQMCLGWVLHRVEAVVKDSLTTVI